MWQEILTKILVIEYNMTVGFTIYVRLLYSYQIDLTGLPLSTTQKPWVKESKHYSGQVEEITLPNRSTVTLALESTPDLHESPAKKHIANSPKPKLNESSQYPTWPSPTSSNESPKTTTERKRRSDLTQNSPKRVKV